MFLCENYEAYRFSRSSTNIKTFLYAANYNPTEVPCNNEQKDHKVTKRRPSSWFDIGHLTHWIFRNLLFKFNS